MGPTFGKERFYCDLQTFTKTVTKSGNHFPLNVDTTSVGTTYNLNGHNSSSITNNNFNVTDLEVYKVEEGGIILGIPWRKDIDWTNKFRKYQIQDESSGKFLSFRICDSRGLEQKFPLDSQEIFCLLDSNIPDCYKFNPTIPFTTNIPGYIKYPDLRDKIHCVAFVIDGSTVYMISDEIYKQMRDLRIKVNHRGLPHIVLLTKVVKICPNVNDDVTNTFTSSAVRDAVNKVADIMGIPRSHVLPVKNYESETELKTEINILLLEALRRCLDLADDFLGEQIEYVPPGKQKCTQDLQK